MALPLMPKATAVWLVENTTLSFEQIADFCGMHALEVQAVADGEVAIGIVGLDPVANGQLTREEIDKGEADPEYRLAMSVSAELVHQKQKGARYTPVAKRQDKPDAVAWLLRHHPDLTDAQISRLIGTTKETIAKVRDRTHWNAQNIKPRNPVTLGLCSEPELEKVVTLAHHRVQQRAIQAARAEARAERQAAQAAAGTPGEGPAETPAGEAPPEALAPAAPAADASHLDMGHDQSEPHHDDAAHAPADDQSES